MADNALSVDQYRELIRQFATSDSFRQLFEGSPVEALSQLGVSQEVISNLKSACLEPKALADKESFAAAYKNLSDEAAIRHASMYIPTLKF